MRTKVTLVLVFLNVALFFFIFKFERNWRTEEAALETRRRVFGPEAADIRSIKVTNHATNTTYALERERDTWSLTAPLSWPANQHAASSIVNELTLLEHRATFSVAEAAKNKQPLSDFGLEKPRLTIEFASGDLAPGTARRSTKVLVGDFTPDDKRLYLLSADGQRVHVVDRTLADRLALPIDQLRTNTLLTIRVFEARSLAIQTAPDPARAGSAGTRARIHRDGQQWRFTAPHTATASKTLVELAINQLHALQAKTFNPTPAPPAAPSSAPLLRVSLEGTNRQETLYVGEPVAGSDVTSLSSKPAREHYAQLEGRPVLFTVVVPTELFEELRNAQESLREKRILEFDPALVTAVTLSAPLQPNIPPVTLQRLEPAPGQPREAEPAWQVIHRSEDAQAPQTLPADARVVRQLLDRLSLLTAEPPSPGVSPFKTDAPTASDLEEWGFNQPARHVALTISGNPTPIVLRIGTDATRTTHYARVGTPTEPGASIYTIHPEIMETLALSPIAWRQRTIGEPLPSAVRIAALKLIDLAENKVLAEHALNAAGEATPPARDPKSLATVLAALRHLRARDFVPGGFAEKIFAAGEDRPWRFQLEATLALPAAPGGQEVTRPLVLLLTERLGGTQQFAGSKELDVAFSLEQPLVDALWSLAYGARDPGPPPLPQKRD